MCKLLRIVDSVFIGSMVCTLLLRWCMHKMCMVDGSIHGLFSFGGIVGFLFVIVSIGMCTITYISKKGFVYGVKFWYQLLS